MTSATDVAQLQRRWILEGWEKAPGETFVFKDKLGSFYDGESADLALYDSFDPELRLARSPDEWADAFEASFNRLHSALHAVIAEPQVLVSGDLSASTFEFCARLQRADGTASGVICRTSHVLRRQNDAWRIVREHTSGRTVPLGEVEELLARFEPAKHFGPERDT
jgi:ketosteroid isomerase-like protein